MNIWVWRTVVRPSERARAPNRDRWMSMTTHHAEIIFCLCVLFKSRLNCYPVKWNAAFD